MVLTFMIFWAPLHFLNVYRFYDKNIAANRHFGDLFFVCHILAVSRSFVNPFIYAWTNLKFRNGFKYFLLCYCLSEKNKNLIHQQQQQRDSVKFTSVYRQNSAQTNGGNANASGAGSRRLSNQIAFQSNRQRAESCPFKDEIVNVRRAHQLASRQSAQFN
jgi:hypothetical protein